MENENEGMTILLGTNWKDMVEMEWSAIVGDKRESKTEYGTQPCGVI